MKKLVLVLSFALIAGVCNAQLTKTYVAKSSFNAPTDIFQSNLYSADRIMEMREKLELTDAQANAIKKIHAETAGEFSTLKWDLDEETKKMKEMLEENQLDDAAVQRQMDKVLALENDLKKKKLTALVAIKNELNDEQIEMLKNRFVVKGSYFFDSNGQNSDGITIVNGKATGYGVSSSSGTTLFPDSKNNKVMIRMNKDKDGEQPLFVINYGDDMVKGYSMKDFDLDPDGIESISVLKDQAAEAVYGEDGKNGVVIITLKDGEKPKKKKK